MTQPEPLPAAAVRPPAADPSPAAAPPGAAVDGVVPAPTAREKRIYRIGVDVLFGLALPAVCLYFDPLVFHSQPGFLPVGSGLAAYALAAYGFIALVTIPFLIHLFTGRAGVLGASGLLAGALACFGLGLILLPISILGTLVAGIGLLGLTPFFTGWVYFRRFLEAFRTLRQRRSFAFCLTAPLLMACLWAMPSFFAQRHVVAECRNGMQQLLDDNPETQAKGLARLQWYSRINSVSLEPLIVAYMTEQNIPRRERLAAAYLQLTGEDIEIEIMRRQD